MTENWRLILRVFLPFAFAFARMPVVWTVVERLLRGDISHPGASRGAAKAAMRAIEGLAKLGSMPKLYAVWMRMSG